MDCTKDNLTPFALAGPARPQVVEEPQHDDEAQPGEGACVGTNPIVTFGKQRLNMIGDML
jgi:hypothetical protein